MRSHAAVRSLVKASEVIITTIVIVCVVAGVASVIYFPLTHAESVREQAYDRVFEKCGQRSTDRFAAFFSEQDFGDLRDSSKKWVGKCDLWF